MEHYGITVPASSARKITLKHGERVGDYQQASQCSDIPDRPGVPTIIAETDGTMVPIVTTEGPKKDRRKNRKLQWKEARLSLAHPLGSLDVKYAATMKDPEETGRQLADCTIRAGAGNQTKFHCVGDGASWIANQVEDKFGTQGSYLIDFFHLCEYFAAAAKGIGDGSPEWLATQKQRMKNNEAWKVLRALELFIEDPEVPDDQAPVKACYRYINNRPDQFNYKDAIKEGLPIGSGEVESGHRHVIQARLKRPGAWWDEENAQYMLNLRTLRTEEEQWELYWYLQAIAA